MKNVTIICIKDHPYYQFKKGKKYKVLYVDNDLYIRYKVSCDALDMVTNFYNGGRYDSIFSNYFVPLSEYRKQKIENILK